MDPSFFDDVLIRLEARFVTLTIELGDKIRILNRKHLDAVRVALDTLRTENAALEAERDPQFRENLRQAVATARETLQGVTDIIDTANASTS